MSILLRKIGTAFRLWRSKDPRFRFFILRIVASWIVPSYRFHWPQLDWWEDEEFAAYLAKFDQLKDSNSHRHWMVGQLLRLTRDVPGDTAECGVFKGASSYLICKDNACVPGRRLHHIFDSFQGLSQPEKRDGAYWVEGDLSCPRETVEKNLAEFGSQAIRVHPGWIPERFGEVADCRFSFVHIDVDLHQPTLDSLAFFYPRMNVGGIILCDDYGFSTCPGATAAFDEYLIGKPERVVGLACGGGFLIKKAPSEPVA